MVLNRGPIFEQTLFDYSGCFYPQGIDSENLSFNQENINKVVFWGQILTQEWVTS